MASFSLPQINDNPDGGWGPSSSNLPAQFKFKDIPYAPYSKTDKLGRFADWNDVSGDNRQNAGTAAQQGNTRGGGPGGRGRRDGQQAFGSGTASAFAYFHAEDESSFSLVDTKTSAARRGGPLGRGRGIGRGGGANRGGAQRGGRGGFNGGRGGGAQRGGRRGWRDWEKNNRSREASVAISPDWAMLEEIEFHRLAKLRLEVDDPEDFTTSTRPMDFAAQLNVSLANGWGIVRTVTDMCMKQPEGKYVLVKDPNKPVLRLYAVPANAFTGEDDEDEGAFDGEEPDSVGAA
ncbi:predicted protein [Postia placenta Mad-698-R]|nr:predicted protein [Postia placenta Mad-698-R]